MTLEEVQVLITARTQGLQNQMNQVTQRLRSVQRQSDIMSQQMARAFGESEANATRSARRIIDSNNQVERSVRSRAATLAAQYRREGLSQSEAFTRAWSEIERSSASGSRGIGRNSRNIRRELEGISRSAQSVQKNVATMSNNMIKTFANLKKAIIALGIGKAIAGAFNMARTYEASVQQVNRIFGLYSGALDAWIEKNAKTFGMARADAMQYASIYGNLVRAFEQDSSKMTYYTTELMKATTIVASSTGRTVKDVSERIRSGILGNTEAIEDLGIYAQVAMLKTSDAFKEVANGRTWDKLTFQEQQQIRVLSILEQASNQFGDSIQNNMNYKLMQLTASLKDTWLYLGQAFMPIVNAVLPILNAMAQALANVTAKLAAFMNALFGTNFHQGAGVDQVGVSANNAASGFGNMSDEAKEAGKEAEKAAKKAKAALAPLDELLEIVTKIKGILMVVVEWVT